jgi:hypothetical protein
MDAYHLGIELHDRCTRGERLTADETLQLEAWYAQQDAIEQAQLTPKAVSTTDLVALQAQTEALLNQLTSVTQRIAPHIKGRSP